jgi:cysteinyl-tRNA synthetase
VRDALAEWPGEVIRLALLSTHYRDPLDWTPDRLKWARQTLDRWYRALREPYEVDKQQAAVVSPEIGHALEDDLNAPLAISRLFNLTTAIYRADPVERFNYRNALIASAQLIGLLQVSPHEWLKGGSDTIDTYIEEQIAARTLARRERRFHDADYIRASLAAEGILLEDKPDGTTEWRRA